MVATTGRVRVSRSLVDHRGKEWSMPDPRRPHRAALALLLAVVALLLALAPPTLSPLGRPPGLAAAAGPAMTGLHVSGNQLLNGGGQAVRLRGVNRSGLEYACIQG